MVTKTKPDPSQIKELTWFQNADIAHALLEGPRSLIPQTRIDHFGWLEPALKIVDYREIREFPSCSYSVFADNTINRMRHFLTPVVRFASWDRPWEYRNRRRARKWPRVDIFQHRLSDFEQARLDQLLMELDEAISGIQYLVGGLITDRDIPRDAVACKYHRAGWFERDNGSQTIRLYFNSSNKLNQEIEKHLRVIMAFIRGVCNDPLGNPYRERYDHHPSADFKSWDCRPRRRKPENAPAPARIKRNRTMTDTTPETK